MIIGVSVGCGLKRSPKSKIVCDMGTDMGKNWHSGMGAKHRFYWADDSIHHIDTEDSSRDYRN